MLNKREIKEFKKGMEETFQVGITSAEQLHKTIAEVPLSYLESIEPIRNQIHEIKEYQNKAITGFYIFLKDVNNRIGEVSDQIIDQIPID